MDKLSFKLDEFIRLAWVSKAAETVWAPILTTLSNFYQQLERESVRAGLRLACIQNCDPLTFADSMVAWAKEGKVIVPIGRVKSTYDYQSATPQLKPSDSWVYRVVIGDPGTAVEIAQAHDQKDWIMEGQWLGYPSCCTNFFQDWWVRKSWMDTTFPMARDWKGGFVHPANNILLRWLGVRWVSHLPCSFTCRATRKIGDTNLKLARELGFNWEADMMMEILSWPIEWSSLHGIAIITTPVFKIVTASDALPEKVSVQLQGDRYPKEGASGTVFPFRNSRMWLDNGFSSRQAMEDAHNQLIDFIKPLMPRSIIDFGCGNMRLMHVCSRLFGAEVTGVDNDASKHPPILSDIFDVKLGDAYDLALISMQRLMENKEKSESWLRDLCSSVKYLVIYDYSQDITVPEEQLSNLTFVRRTPRHILLRLQYDKATLSNAG